MGSRIVVGSSDVGASANLARNVHELSDGSTLVVVLQGNAILNYWSADRINWVLKTNTPGFFGTFSTFNTALGPDGSIHMVYRDSTGVLKYVKWTHSGIGSSQAWTTGTAETVKTGTNMSLCDIDILDTDTNGVPIVAAMDVSSPATLRLFVRRTSDNTWINFRSIKVSNNAHSGPQGVTIARGLNQVDTTAHTATFATACLAGDTSFQTGDLLVVGAGVNYVTGVAGVNGFSATNVFAGTNKATIRSYQLFSIGTDRWDLVCVVGNGYLDARVARVASTGFIVNYTKLPFNPGTPANRAITGTYSELACAHNGESVVVVFQGQAGGQPRTCNVHARVSDAGVVWIPPNNSTATGADFWNSNLVGHLEEDTIVNHIFGGGNRNLGLNSSKRVSIAYATTDSFSWFYTSNAYGAASPKNATPATGSTVATNTPSLQTKLVNSGAQQGRRKAVFQIASDSNFTTNLHTVVQDDLTYTVVPATGTATFQVLVTILNELFQGTWFMRSATMDAWGVQSPWSATTSFIISHPPSAVAQAPNGELKLAFGSGDVSFNWTFKSTQVDSKQTAYQILIEKDTSEGATAGSVFDTGKVASTANSTVINIDMSMKNIPLRWSVKVWDEDDVASVYSFYATFKMVDPSIVNFTTPADGAVVNNPTPDIVWVFTGSSSAPVGGPGSAFPSEILFPSETTFPGET